MGKIIFEAFILIRKTEIFSYKFCQNDVFVIPSAHKLEDQNSFDK